MENIAKQISDSGTIYQLINIKLDEVSREVRASCGNYSSEYKIK